MKRMNIISLVLVVLALALLTEGKKKSTKAKSGTCPEKSVLHQRLSEKCPVTSEHQCETDTDCPGRKKCCGCPKKCVRAVTLRSTIKCRIRLPPVLPDFCASVSVLSECNAHSDCGRKGKCCPSSVCGGGTCIRAGKTDRRPRCPSVPKDRPESCPPNTPIYQCQSDGDCTRKETCCPGACGGTGCVRRAWKPAPFV